jgi:hypothetical protein
MDRSRIPGQMMTYRPKGKRFFGRPLKRWRETVTGHWGLIRVRKKKKTEEAHCKLASLIYSTSWIHAGHLSNVRRSWSSNALTEVSVLNFGSILDSSLYRSTVCTLLGVQGGSLALLTPPKERILYRSIRVYLACYSSVQTQSLHTPVSLDPHIFHSLTVFSEVDHWHYFLSNVLRLESNHYQDAKIRNWK